MNCLSGRTLKLFLQIYDTSAWCNWLRLVKRMSDHSVSQKLPLSPTEKLRENENTDDFLGIGRDHDLDDDRAHSRLTDSSDVTSNTRFANAASYVESTDRSLSRRSSVKQTKPKQFQNLKKTKFGFVRFDENNRGLENSVVNENEKLGRIKISENKMKSKCDRISSSFPTFDKTVAAPFERSSDNSSIFDSQYFNYEKKAFADLNSEEEHLNMANLWQEQNSDEQLLDQKDIWRQSMSENDASTAFNFIDGQYFENTSTPNDDMENYKNNGVHIDTSTRNVQTSRDMNYVDDQYFGNPGLPDMSTVLSQLPSTSSLSDKHTDSFFNSQVISTDVDKDTASSSEQTFLQYGTLSQKNLKKLKHKDPLPVGDSETHVQNSKKRQTKESLRVHVSETKSNNSKHATDGRTQETDPESAYYLAMKIRREMKSKGQHVSKENVVETNELDHERRYAGPVDSKGFRILKNQVPDFGNTPSVMIANELKKSIIYNKGDVIAIYKPYGLPSHGGPGVRVSVGQLLPQLCDMLSGKENINMLHLVHRLDKETTGVMLLAKTPEMAWRLKNAFRKQEVMKMYWVIVKGIPKPSEGIIDIPMSEGKVEGIHRMVLRPDYTEYTKLTEKKRSIKSYRAITRYRVLESASDAALVECQPHTGVKHQIRVHLAYGLNTPILGDHKYSHFTKLAPQRLFPDMLQQLGIRQSKVRHVPMHLHAKSIVIPEILDGQNLAVSCRLPRHFVTNMSRLRLKPATNS
ncbi:uncharacterized protein LOC121367341 [Gigantopelta aegis]|uniref:uncharacterized protein LOC121367341 n=1 Tax=Gigantopelta aegis TaxID=1735272 RepID=UPI001B8897B9|nr:uncharacterized protein LOC121367341 [Gigantopelta aegis]